MTDPRSTAPHAPRVSVSMTAFRHARWIGRAIESVLAQDFDDWEIIVADDASDDRTVEVVRGYHDACIGPYGPRLRVLPHDAKVGQRQNYMRALRACRGDFIAQLDGDDYFVDPEKLSKQVALLDEDPSLAGVFGAWLETDQDGENGVETRGFGVEGRSRFGVVDFGALCRTTSAVVLFRRGLFGDFPEWFERADVGDWPLHVLNLLGGGEYLYVPDVLSAHRNHPAGIWTRRSDEEKARGTIRMHEMFLAELPPEVASEMLPQMLSVNLCRGRIALGEGDPSAALVYFDWCDRRRLKRPSRFKLWKLQRRAKRALRAAG